jgi:tRNA(Ile)-lysidine synthase
VNKLVEAIDQAIRVRRLFSRSQSILLAVSGGLDSTVLLRVLHHLARNHKWKLIVAHFNHQLRGADSDEDEQFVKSASAELKLRFVSAREPVGAFAKRGGVSIEMAARKLRHDFLARSAKRLRVKTVALAHHADDQVELFFLRLLRGAGGAGLSGMKWSSPSPSDGAIQLVRPLLAQSRAALRRYAEEEEVVFREDATNADPDFLRNRIRQKLLPVLLQEYQPALPKLIVQAMDILGEEGDFARRAADEWLLEKKRISFEKLHTAVQRQVIQRQLIQIGVNTDFDLIERLRVSPKSSVSVGAEFEVYRDDRGRVRRRDAIHSLFKSDEIAVDLKSDAGSVMFGGLEFNYRIGSTKSKPGFAKGREYFDVDKVGSRIILRHWRAGDRFQPTGMKNPVKLQDLLSNQKIPRAQRHQLVVVTTAKDEIFWVEGLRIGERFKLDNRTIRRLKWQWSGR